MLPCMYEPFFTGTGEAGEKTRPAATQTGEGERGIRGNLTLRPPQN